MKKYGCFFLVPLLAMIGSFFGCKSAGVVIADHSPVAVVSVIGNQSLPWKEPSNQNDDDDKDNGTGLLSTLTNKLINGDSVELTSAQDRLDYAADQLIALINENSGAEVLDRDMVLSSEAYLDSRENILKFMEAKLTATNYKNLTSLGAKRARMLMDDLGAKSLICVEFLFQKTNVSGNKWTGKVGAYVEMKIRVLDDRGTEIVNRDYSATSADSLPIRSRKYDKDALVDLFPDTIDSVISQFIVDNM